MFNHYDQPAFFEAYAKMSRSQNGLKAAGEWHQFERLFQPLDNQLVLDLGCGYGWHCEYAASHGAKQVLGIDISQKMLEKARTTHAHPGITYDLCGIEDYTYPKETWDWVISNLALHYIADLDTLFAKVYHTLKPGGTFLFNIEHPTFTSGVHQDWLYDENGKILCWPIDDYFKPGPRTTLFLNQEITKQHHTLTQILMGLRKQGFSLDVVEEALPTKEMVDELRRPMMLLVRACKSPLK